MLTKLNCAYENIFILVPEMFLHLLFNYSIDICDFVYSADCMWQVIAPISCYAHTSKYTCTFSQIQKHSQRHSVKVSYKLRFPKCLWRLRFGWDCGCLPDVL